MSGHGPHADHNDPFQKKVAVFLAAYAALLAFTTMLTNQARTSAILLASESSNQWAFFQSKSMKGIVTRAELELLDHLSPKKTASLSLPEGTKLATAPAHGEPAKTDAAHASTPAESGHAVETEHPTGNAHHTTADAAARTEIEADPAALRARLVADISRYDQEKDHIQQLALEKAEAGHHQQHREHLFEYAATLSELAIVVAGVALLMRSNPGFLLSLGVAGMSIVLTAYTALT
jgi:hypothetical protein